MLEYIQKFIEKFKMTISKILTTLGIILIIWALISGFYFYYSTDAAGSNFEGGYSLKVGTLIIGAILVFFGRKMR